MNLQRPPTTRPPRRTISGILPVDKPSGWTSHDVVAKLRGHFHLAKLGHAGTLDPVATGVLVLLSGDATKAADRLIADDKEYRFVLKFGLVTDTHDVTGTIVSEQADPPGHTAGEIEAVLGRFRGPIMQTPPMFSAVKVQGTRLYKLGRKGKEIERDARPITVSELVLEHIEWPRATLRAVCSKGTYVRSLCHDIGGLIGCGGCMESLIRLRSGAYKIEQARTLDEILKWTPEQFAAHLLPIPA